MRIGNGDPRYTQKKRNRRNALKNDEHEYEPKRIRFSTKHIFRPPAVIPNQGDRLFPERPKSNLLSASGGGGSGDLWQDFVHEFIDPDSLLNQTDDKIRDAFKKIENDLGEVFDPNKNGVRELFTNFKNEVGPVLSQFGDDLKYELDPDLNGVNAAWRQAKGDIDEAFRIIGEKMWNFYKSYLYPTWYLSLLGRAFKPLGDFFANTLDKDWWEDKLNDPETYFWIAQTVLTCSSAFMGPGMLALSTGVLAAARLITKAAMDQPITPSDLLDLGLCLIPTGRVIRPPIPGGNTRKDFAQFVMEGVTASIKNQRMKDPNARLRSMGQGLCACVAVGEEYGLIPPINKKGYIQTAIQNSNKNIERAWEGKKEGEYKHRYKVYVRDMVNVGKKQLRTMKGEPPKEQIKEVDDIKAVESFTVYDIVLDDFKDRDIIPKVIAEEQMALKLIEMWKHNKGVERDKVDYDTRDLLADIPLEEISGTNLKTGEVFKMKRPQKPDITKGMKVGNIFLFRFGYPYTVGEFAAKSLDTTKIPPKGSDTDWQNDPKKRVFECMKDVPDGLTTLLPPAPKDGETFESVYQAQVALNDTKKGYWRECTYEYANDQPGATISIDPREQYITDCAKFREYYNMTKFNESYAVDLARDRTIIQDRLKTEFPVRLANSSLAWLTAIIKNEVESYSRAIQGQSTVYNYKTNKKLKEDNTQYMFKYYSDYWYNYYHGPNYFLSVEEAKAYYALNPDKYPGKPIFERDYSTGTSGNYFDGKQWIGYDPDMLNTQKKIKAIQEGKVGKKTENDFFYNEEEQKLIRDANEFGFNLEGEDVSRLVMVDPGQPPFNPDDYGLDFHKQVELHMYRFFTVDFNESNKHVCKTDKGDSFTCPFNTSLQFPNPDKPNEMLSFSKIVDEIEKELNKNYTYDDDRIRPEKFENSEAFFQTVLGMSREEKLKYLRNLFDTFEIVLEAMVRRNPSQKLHDSIIWNNTKKRIELPALSPQQLVELGIGKKINQKVKFSTVDEEYVDHMPGAKNYAELYGTTADGTRLNWIAQQEYEKDLAYLQHHPPGSSTELHPEEVFRREWEAELSRIHDYDEKMYTVNVLAPQDKGTEAVSFPWQIAPPWKIVPGKNDDTKLKEMRAKRREGIRLTDNHTNPGKTTQSAQKYRAEGQKLLKEYNEYMESMKYDLYPFPNAWTNYENNRMWGGTNEPYNGVVTISDVLRVFKGSQVGSTNPKTSFPEFAEDYFVKYYMDEAMAKPRPAMTEKIGRVDRVIDPWNSYKGLAEKDRPYTRKEVETKAYESIKKAAVMLAAQNPNFYEVYTTNGMTDVIKYYKTIMKINDIEERNRYPDHVKEWENRFEQFKKETKDYILRTFTENHSYDPSETFLYKIKVEDWLKENPHPTEPLPLEDPQTQYENAMKRYTEENALYDQAKEADFNMLFNQLEAQKELGIKNNTREDIGQAFENRVKRPSLPNRQYFNDGEDYEEDRSEILKEDSNALEEYNQQLTNYTTKKNAYIQEYLNRVPPEQRTRGFRNEQEIGDYYDNMNNKGVGDNNVKPTFPILKADGSSPVFRSSDPKRDAYLQKTRRNYEANRKIREGYTQQSEEDIKWLADRKEYQLKLKHDVEDMKAELKAEQDRMDQAKNIAKGLDVVNKENQQAQIDQEKRLLEFKQQQEIEAAKKEEERKLLELERERQNALDASRTAEVQKAEAERQAKVKSEQEAFFKNYEETRLKNAGLPSFPENFERGTYDRSVVINGVFTPHYPVEVFMFGNTPISNYINPNSPVKAENVLSKPGEAYHPKPINIQYAKEAQLAEQADKEEEALKQNPDLIGEDLDPYDEVLLYGNLSERDKQTIPLQKLLHPNASRAYVRMMYELDPPTPEFLSGAMGAGKRNFNYKRKKLNRL
jgi:hypothetical protein